MALYCFLSCEHGGNHIPKTYAHLFAGAEETLESHRGWDIGTPELFEEFSRLGRFHHAQISGVSRLLVDLNRSLTSRHLFSEFTQDLPKVTKKQILNEYYHPYRQQFHDAVTTTTEQGHHVVHVSLHTFSPVVHGKIRKGDIGVLYDPGHGREKEFAGLWISVIRQNIAGLQVRANYPYRGTADGHPIPFRKKLAKKYIGIELELNQRFSAFPALHTALAASFTETVDAFLNTAG